MTAQLKTEAVLVDLCSFYEEDHSMFEEHCKGVVTEKEQFLQKIASEKLSPLEARVDKELEAATLGSQLLQILYPLEKRRMS